jgi:hypothetical protein
LHVLKATQGAQHEATIQAKDECAALLDATFAAQEINSVNYHAMKEAQQALVVAQAALAAAPQQAHT